ncbi:hypothetical protein Glove_343g27 [Diversispora epigaea]|uniref:Uncharacterized protein n=1 Tax=Diversispora epigaea TaxID=1348612 RepID=A0A397HGB7_9GLOM|nr:hypothetical protein Glove_343g27 [Diversispora epigaea]
MNTLTPEYLEWEAKLTELPSILTDKIRSRFCKRYKKKTGLNPWLNSETFESSQIEKTDNHLSRDCIIKIFKFPEEKSTIHKAVHKHFPFLSYTNSNAWHRDVFKYTDSEAKCPVCKEVHTRLGIWGDWSCLSKDEHYFLNCPFRIDQKKVIIAVQSLPKTQVRVPNKTREVDPEKILIITEAEKKRWDGECFREDLERDIRFYRGGIERKEDPRKYREFLTDRDRLVGEELLCRSILESGLSTVWLDDLMEEWQKTYNQFVQIFYQNFNPIEEKTLFVPRVNVLSTPSKRQFPTSVLPKDPEERQQHVIEMLLERFPYLTLKHSFNNDYFDFNSSIFCPLCNKNHKKENIRNRIEGFWGSGEFYGEKAYHLYCYTNKY